MGLIRGYVVMGIIDELRLEKIKRSPQDKRPPSPRKSQRLISSYFTKPLQADETATCKPPRVRTHRLLISDSKTRSSGRLPPLENAKSGMTQLMCYKEILDGLLVARWDDKEVEPVTRPQDEQEDAEQVLADAPNGTCPPGDISSLDSPMDRVSWSKLFQVLKVDQNARFSEEFVSQAKAMILSNGLDVALIHGTCLVDFVNGWIRHVQKLGLGDPKCGDGMSDNKLELVYRNSNILSTKSPVTGRSRSDPKQSAKRLRQSSGDGGPPMTPPTDQERAPRGDEGVVQELESEPAIDNNALSASQQSMHKLLLGGGPSMQKLTITLPSPNQDSKAETSPPEPAPLKRKRAKAGSIIGSHIFTHDRSLLADSLSRTVGFWMGTREPEGVSIEHTDRCRWCEFEQGCEWR